MSEYYIHMAPKSATRWKQVEGRRLSIAGFEEFDLFAHQSRYDEGTIIPDYWTVSEGQTGLALGEGETEDEAIAYATEQLNRRGVEAFRDRIAGKIAQYGLSPLYAGAGSGR